uniref:Uncharacterized protein n=1 Tax=Arundo donax TaxID=35708 RepID=A0A0A9DRP7_ARUDO
MAPSFQTRYAVPNMMVVMSVNDTRTRNTSTPNGSSNVHPSLGIPRLLSSNRFPGASGSRDRRRPPPAAPAFFASASRSASSTPLPNSGFPGFHDGDAPLGFRDAATAPFPPPGSAYLPSTRAARSCSRAVSGARFGGSSGQLPFGCCGWPLPGVTGAFSAPGLGAAGGGVPVAVSCAAAGAAWSLSVAGQLVLAACLFLGRGSSGGSFRKAVAAAAFWKGCL